VSGIIIFIPAVFVAQTITTTGSPDLTLTSSFIVFWLLIFLCFYLINIAYVTFLEKKKVFSTIKETLKLGFTRIHKFILPYFFIILLFFVVSLITSGINLISAPLGLFINSIAFFALFAWLKLYLVPVVQKVSGKKSKA
jgi:hypothetical protein